MKTVAELAKKLNVSTQTIYRKLNSVQQGVEECLTEKRGVTSYVTEYGESLIRECLTGVQRSSTDVEHGNSEIIELLKSQLDRKDEQIAAKDEQISELLKKLENMQILLKAEQDKNILLLASGDKEPFWRKWFRRGADNHD